MQATKYSAMGVFESLDKAERTVDELRQAGYPASQIGIIGHVGDGLVPIPRGMKTPEENAADFIWKGGILGAVIGVLVSAVIPGLGELSGFGRWFEIAAAAAFGAAISGVVFGFVSFAYEKTNARHVANELESGHVIVTVTTAQRDDRAVQVLRHKAEEVSIAHE